MDARRRIAGIHQEEPKRESNQPVGLLLFYSVQPLTPCPVAWGSLRFSVHSREIIDVDLKGVHLRIERTLGHV